MRSNSVIAIGTVCAFGAANAIPLPRFIFPHHAHDEIGSWFHELLAQEEADRELAAEQEADYVSHTPVNHGAEEPDAPTEHDVLSHIIGPSEHSVAQPVDVHGKVIEATSDLPALHHEDHEWTHSHTGLGFDSSSNFLDTVHKEHHKQHPGQHEHPGGAYMGHEKITGHDAHDGHHEQRVHTEPVYYAASHNTPGHTAHGDIYAYSHPDDHHRSVTSEPYHHAAGWKPYMHTGQLGYDHDLLGRQTYHPTEETFSHSGLEQHAQFGQYPTMPEEHHYLRSHHDPLFVPGTDHYGHEGHSWYATEGDHSHYAYDHEPSHRQTSHPISPSYDYHHREQAKMQPGQHVTPGHQHEHAFRGHDGHLYYENEHGQHLHEEQARHVASFAHQHLRSINSAFKHDHPRDHGLHTSAIGGAHDPLLGKTLFDVMLDASALPI